MEGEEGDNALGPPAASGQSPAAARRLPHSSSGPIALSVIALLPPYPSILMMTWVNPCTYQQGAHLHHNNARAQIKHGWGDQMASFCPQQRNSKTKKG